MQYENINKESIYIEQIHKLYEHSFPRDEKMKWSQLVKNISDHDILTAYFNDDHQFVGFTYIFLGEQAVYLSYFAVELSLRDRGYGSEILKTLTGMIDKKIIIDIEELNDKAPNAIERRNRRNFYIHNGFQETGIFYNFWHVDYELLSINGTATREDWNTITSQIWGKFAKMIVYKEGSL